MWMCGRGDHASVLLPKTGHQRQQGNQPSTEESVLCSPKDRSLTVLFLETIPIALSQYCRHVLLYLPLDNCKVFTIHAPDI